MTYKAVGIESGTVYATGSYPECVRRVNQQKHDEATKIIPLHQPYTPTTAEEETERLAKEWQLAELQERNQAANKKTHNKPRVWTKEEDEWFVKHIDESTNWLMTNMEVMFGRQVTAPVVHNHKHKLRKKLGLNTKQRHNSWTEAEDAYLIAHYQSFTAADIGRDINRTVRAVEMRAKMFREIGILQSKGYKNNGGRRK